MVRAVRLLRMPLWTLILLDLQANLLVGYEAMQRMRKGSRQASLFEQRNGQLEQQPPAPAERPEENKLQQLLNKADAVVPEHHAVAFLGCVEISIGANSEIAIAIRIAEGLLYVPYMLRILVGFVDSQECH